jgi:hypothetical protein
MKEKDEEFSPGYGNYFKNPEKERGDIIKVASKPIEVYVYSIIQKFQTNDQVELQVLDEHRGNAMILINLLHGIGILPLGGFPLKFESKEEDICNRRGEKQSRRIVNKIILTKIPELYRFTKN